MVFRSILRILLSRHASQVSEPLIKKLSDSYLIRRAAQITAYLFLRSKDHLKELQKKDALKDVTKKAEDIRGSLKEEIQKFKDKMK